MSNPGLTGSELCGAHLRRSLFCIALLFTPLAGINAQEANDHDHDHDQLHFSHPLVTESPSPDTKIRVDLIRTQTNGTGGLRENSIRVEGEYAFNHNVSLAVIAPYISRTAPAAERASGVGNVELSLKGASFAFAERGILLGGGLSAAFPTGSDAKAIGSSHLVELEPFLDAAYKMDALELVGLASLSSTFRRRTGEEAERNLTFDFSALYQVQPRIEGLIEVTSARALVGPESGLPQTLVAPGIKVYPFASRKIMFGGNVAFGTGDVRDTRSLLLSGFYHF